MKIRCICEHCFKILYRSKKTNRACPNCKHTAFVMGLFCSDCKKWMDLYEISRFLSIKYTFRCAKCGKLKIWIIE